MKEGEAEGLVCLLHSKEFLWSKDDAVGWCSAKPGSEKARYHQQKSNAPLIEGCGHKRGGWGSWGFRDQ